MFSVAWSQSFQWPHLFFIFSYKTLVNTPEGRKMVGGGGLHAALSTEMPHSCFWIFMFN
jgi:hypothetical protein